MRSGCSWLPLMRYDERHGQELQDPGERARLESPDEHARDQGNERNHRHLIQHVDDVGGLSGGDAGANQEDRRQQDPDWVLAEEPVLIPRAAPLRRDPA